MSLGHTERRALFRAMLLVSLWTSLDLGCRTAGDPARWGEEHHYEAAETVSIKTGRHGFPLVPGKVNGRDIDVFFDTGNFFGLLIGPRWVRDLNLAPSGNERKNYGSDGAYRYALKGYFVESFGVFRTEHKNVEMFEMTDDVFDASVGIGELWGRWFTIDLKNRLMGISGEPAERGRPGTDEFPLIWNEALKGMIVIEGRVNGVGTLVQIDTGKSRTTIDRVLISRAGLKENNTLFQQGYKVDSIVLGTKSFTVECAKVTSFDAISAGYPGPILLGIGADILSRMVLTVDTAQKRVFIK